MHLKIPRFSKKRFSLCVQIANCINYTKGVRTCLSLTLYREQSLYKRRGRQGKNNRNTQSFRRGGPGYEVHVLWFGCFAFLYYGLIFNFWNRFDPVPALLGGAGPKERKSGNPHSFLGRGGPDTKNCLKKKNRNDNKVKYKENQKI